MGSCLDSERSNDSVSDEEQSWYHTMSNNNKNAHTPSSPGQFPMLNGITIHFEEPKVPVVFVLGGPGSGKVTHCDTMAEENYGIVHVNMTDILQQYSMGNDMQDFSELSSTTVTEVLMLEMKMAPYAKAFLISGYPRNMGDVVEYSEKIKTLSGVVLIVWREKVLERQISYGAKLGQVVISLARMELSNFFRNVIPVADYFSHSNLLSTVNGEKQPDEVYRQFKSSILEILNKGNTNNTELTDFENYKMPSTVDVPLANGTAIVPNSGLKQETPNLTKNYPRILWIIGGPGSNKAILCDQAVLDTGWAHISLGRVLRSAADINDAKRSQEVKKIRQCLIAGELVPIDIVMKYVESYVSANLTSPGILLDGYPRNMQQVTEFEKKFEQKPNLILLDCSKLQLGRGRLDDSVTAFRRRLEVFRQSSLPMLRSLDNVGRLTIVDGDTDASSVREDFQNVLQEHINNIRRQSGNELLDTANSISLISNNIVSNINNNISNNKLVNKNTWRTAAKHIKSQFEVVQNGTATFNATHEQNIN